MLIDFGLVGLGFFLALRTGLRCARLWRHRDPLSLYALSCIVFLLLSVLTLNMADNFLYWAFLGYALAVAYFQKECAESGPPLTSVSPNTYALPRTGIIYGVVLKSYELF